MHTNTHYELISRAIRWLDENRTEQPGLEQLAKALQVSPHHLQRTFQAWAGVSPKQFLKSLTRKSAVARLVGGDTVLDTAYAVGLSSPGRLHDLLVTTEALTPGQVRNRGEGVVLEFGHGPTPFGDAVVAWSPKGLSFLGFCGEMSIEQVVSDLRQSWPRAEFRENPRDARGWLDRVFADSRDRPLPVWLHGSPFQLKVWEALLTVPEGAMVTYGELARRLGQPLASRAVGSAVGANPVAWIIPCHRVIRQMGEIGNYRWGAVTKHAMIGLEASRTSLPGPGTEVQVQA